MKKVIIIEDEEVGKMWKQLLESFGIETILAETFEEALEVIRALARIPYQKHSRIKIIMDGRIGGGEFNCLPLLAEIPKGLVEDVVASSGEPKLREIQMRNGCTRDSGGKENVPAILIEFAHSEQLSEAA